MTTNGVTVSRPSSITICELISGVFEITVAGTSFIILSITSALSPVRMHILLSNKDERSEKSLVNGPRFLTLLTSDGICH